jgi:hypothetical protein
MFPPYFLRFTQSHPFQLSRRPRKLLIFSLFAPDQLAGPTKNTTLDTSHLAHGNVTSLHDAKMANADSFVGDTTENWGLPLTALFDADVQLSKDTDLGPLKLLGALSKFLGAHEL